MGVAVYAGLVGALLLCVILVLCVGVLAYRRRCSHLHGDITDSSSALAAAFHPGNYKPPRQGKLTHTNIHPRCYFLSLFFFAPFAPAHRSMSSRFIQLCFLFLSGILFIPWHHYLLSRRQFSLLYHITYFRVQSICRGISSLVLAIKY